ncbi:nucleoside/nucleotide kinase family protein [Wenxinia saemankumensis]|uniref:Fructokinase n=1 Tax=Wenxinia saemankumensis TaxID=1447782 RepID=A0A1M6AY21_9RHOB|nr:nucleoside/nucleotide kinase family protein [Wenxinia saemankumensis]SHI41331.1 fructokinase [Wenxinia saemankumensis]
MKNITAQVTLLSDRLHELRRWQDRLVVGIAGAPGSGKSTLAGELAKRMNVQKVPTVVVPMDGFHLDNAVLEARGLLPRKGAPESFDANGFLSLMRRIRAGEEVFAPVFDRTRDIAIAGAQEVAPWHRVVIVEGNYLLLDEAPWSALADLWDVSVYLDVELPELRARLIQRWLSHNLSRAAATRRAEANDLVNATRVIERRLEADHVLT